MVSPGSVACTVAKNFLQTVVIVDDQAGLGPNESSPRSTASEWGEAASLSHADDPVADANVKSEVDGEVEATPESGLSEPGADALSVAEHGDLDAKTIINDFAHLGLVCGVIRPEQDEDIGPIVDPAAKRADVLVLDWWMHHDGGATSRSIISQLAQSDDQQDRIRLIVIYTAVPDLSKIASEVARMLDGAQVIGDKGNRVAAGSIRLVVLAKPDTKVDPTLAEEVVPFSDLPNRVINEFAVAVEGLLSNVAFAAVAAIRNNTHRILNRFDRTLDPAFLGHRMLLPDPEDSELHLVELILQELSAVLDSAEVGRNADYSAIRQLVSDAVLVVEDVYRIGEFAARNGLSTSELAMRFVQEGVSDPNCGLSNNERKDIRGWISKIFALGPTNSGGQNANINEQWSMLMSSKLDYGRSSPKLRLGVLVRDSQSGVFMLCMQPVCDSVRLSAPTAFPFLPLEQTAGSSDVVIKYAEEYYPLNLKLKFRDLLMVTFEPSADSGGSVRAQRSAGNEGWQFVPASDRAPLEWAGELRDSFAHKFANRFAESASRVGTNDSELFRRLLLWGPGVWIFVSIEKIRCGLNVFVPL